MSSANQQQKDPYQKKQELEQNTFKQQALPAIWPDPDQSSFSKKNAGMMFFFSLMFMIFGAVLLGQSGNVVDASVRYDETCDSTLNKAAMCDVQLKIEKDMKKPVYFYYSLNNFYQNHRRYVKSRDTKQLRGIYRTATESQSQCDPIVKNGDLWDYQKTSVNKKALNNDDVAVPCGLIAKSLFNDGFQMYDSKNNRIDISEKNIAWQSDIAYKYKNLDTNLPSGKSWQDIQWTNMEDEHFIVWMRQAGLPNFKKLWGIIDKDLAAGTYKVKVQNKYIVKPFKGEKSVVVSTATSIGGKQNLMGVIYLLLSVLSLVFGIIFWCSANKSQQQ